MIRRLSASLRAAGMAAALGVGMDSAYAAEVTLTVADGTALKATYHSPGRPGPAMLLIHQCNMDRASWDGLAARLVATGVHVLAPDLRGFGAHRVDGRVPSEKWRADLDAWWSYLASRPDVDRSRMAAGGASCGVAESTLLAARHSEVHALLLLSGAVNLDGKDQIAATSPLAVFGAAAEQDGPDSIRDAVAASKNAASVMKIYPGVDHGVDLLRAHGDLEAMILQWLTARFATAPVR